MNTLLCSGNQFDTAQAEQQDGGLGSSRDVHGKHKQIFADRDTSYTRVNIVIVIVVFIGCCDKLLSVGKYSICAYVCMYVPNSDMK